MQHQQQQGQDEHAARLAWAKQLVDIGGFSTNVANMTQAQRDGRFGGASETPAQRDARAAAGFGGADETQEQRDARAAAQFGGADVTQAQLDAAAEGGRKGAGKAKPRLEGPMGRCPQCGKVGVLGAKCSRRDASAGKVVACGRYRPDPMQPDAGSNQQ